MVCPFIAVVTLTKHHGVSPTRCLLRFSGSFEAQFFHCFEELVLAHMLPVKKTEVNQLGREHDTGKGHGMRWATHPSWKSHRPQNGLSGYLLSPLLFARQVCQFEEWVAPLLRHVAIAEHAPVTSAACPLQGDPMVYGTVTRVWQKKSSINFAIHLETEEKYVNNTEWRGHEAGHLSAGNFQHPNSEFRCPCSAGA